MTLPFCRSSSRLRGWQVLRVTLPAICCASLALADPPAAPPHKNTAGRGYLGVIISEICPEVRAQTILKEGEGLLIGRVAADSPAAALGLLHYDILTKFNDQWLMSPSQFVTLVENAGPGTEVELTYLRKGTEAKAKVTLGTFPANAAAVAAPLPEEMLTSVIRALRDDPATLEAVHRMLQNRAAGLPDDPMATAGLQHGSRVTLRDEAGKLELTMIGKDQKIRAWDKAGLLIFEGPCNTPAQEEAIPEGLRPRLETLRQECHASRQSQQSNPEPSSPGGNPVPAPAPIPVAPVSR